MAPGVKEDNFRGKEDGGAASRRQAKSRHSHKGAGGIYAELETESEEPQ